jgi:hypothetical protein
MEDAWKALAGVLGVVFWMLSLARKKRKQRGDTTGQQPTAPARRAPEPPSSRDSQEFKRDYDPIEPS